MKTRQDKPLTDEQRAELNELRAYCKEQNIPGPDVVEHDEGYEGDCFCQLCLSYG